MQIEFFTDKKTTTLDSLKYIDDLDTLKQIIKDNLQITNQRIVFVDSASLEKGVIKTLGQVQPGMKIQVRQFGAEDTGLDSKDTPSTGGLEKEKSDSKSKSGGNSFVLANEEMAKRREVDSFIVLGKTSESASSSQNGVSKWFDQYGNKIDSNWNKSKEQENQEISGKSETNEDLQKQIFSKVPDSKTAIENQDFNNQNQKIAIDLPKTKKTIFKEDESGPRPNTVKPKKRKIYENSKVQEILGSLEDTDEFDSLDPKTVPSQDFVYPPGFAEISKLVEIKRRFSTSSESSDSYNSSIFDSAKTSEDDKIIDSKDEVARIIHSATKPRNTGLGDVKIQIQKVIGEQEPDPKAETQNQDNLNDQNEKIHGLLEIEGIGEGGDLGKNDRTFGLNQSTILGEELETLIDDPLKKSDSPKKKDPEFENIINSLWYLGDEQEFQKLVGTTILEEEMEGTQVNVIGPQEILKELEETGKLEDKDKVENQDLEIPITETDLMNSEQNVISGFELVSKLVVTQSENLQRNQETEDEPKHEDRTEDKLDVEENAQSLKKDLQKNEETQENSEKKENDTNNDKDVVVSEILIQEPSPSKEQVQLVDNAAEIDENLDHKTSDLAIQSESLARVPVAIPVASIIKESKDMKETLEMKEDVSDLAKVDSSNDLSGTIKRKNKKQKKEKKLKEKEEKKRLREEKKEKKRKEKQEKNKRKRQEKWEKEQRKQMEKEEKDRRELARKGELEQREMLEDDERDMRDRGDCRAEKFWSGRDKKCSRRRDKEERHQRKKREREEKNERKRREREERDMRKGRGHRGYKRGSRTGHPEHKEYTKVSNIERAEELTDVKVCKTKILETSSMKLFEDAILNSNEIKKLISEKEREVQQLLDEGNKQNAKIQQQIESIKAERTRSGVFKHFNVNNTSRRLALLFVQKKLAIKENYDRIQKGFKGGLKRAKQTIKNSFKTKCKGDKTMEQEMKLARDKVMDQIDEIYKHKWTQVQEKLKHDRKQMLDDLKRTKKSFTSVIKKSFKDAKKDKVKGGNIAETKPENKDNDMDSNIPKESNTASEYSYAKFEEPGAEDPQKSMKRSHMRSFFNNSMIANLEELPVYHFIFNLQEDESSSYLDEYLAQERARMEAKGKLNIRELNRRQQIIKGINEEKVKLDKNKVDLLIFGTQLRKLGDFINLIEANKHIYFSAETD